MKLTTLLTLNAILSLAFGIAFSLYGPIMIAFFGVPDLPEENILLYWNVASFARMFGAALFGFGLLLWSIKALIGSHPGVLENQRGVTFALLLANAMGLFVATTQQYAIWGSPAGWVVISFFGLFFLGYAFFLFSRQGSSLA